MEHVSAEALSAEVARQLAVMDQNLARLMVQKEILLVMEPVSAEEKESRGKMLASIEAQTANARRAIDRLRQMQAG